MGRKSNYENGMFNQLQEIMNRLDSVEKELRTEKKEHREDVVRLNKKIDEPTQENSLLRNDNARLRSIINNDSSNSSLPPSSDQKGGRYVTKYVIDLKTETVITELRIYADEQGKFNIPPQYRSDVTYGENVKAFCT